jgi:hypothetical protein
MYKEENHDRDQPRCVHDQPRALPQQGIQEKQHNNKKT